MGTYEKSRRKAGSRFSVRQGLQLAPSPLDPALRAAGPWAPQAWSASACYGRLRGGSADREEEAAAATARGAGSVGAKIRSRI